MGKILRLVGLLSLVATGALHAAPILVTSQAALGPNDSVNWSQLGADGATIPASFGATSVNGRAIAGSLGGTGCVAVVGGSNCSWSSGPGFAAGNFVLWTEDANGAGSGPLSFSFASVLGAGLWIQANALGQFRAQIQAFNGVNSLGTFSELSDAAGDGIFIGVLDTISDITRVVFSLTSCGNASAGCDLGDFAVNSLLLKTAASTVPEPTSLSLLLLGAGGLALFRRSRRVNRAAVNEEKNA